MNPENLNEPTSPNPRLEALEHRIKETEDANPDPAAQQAEQTAKQAAQEAEQGAQEWGMLMFTLGGLACMIAPELRPTYSQDRCLTWGTHAHAVSVKYGWTSPSIPEIALVASTISFALPTWILVRQRLALLKKREGTWSEKLAAWWHSRKAKKPEAGAEDGGQ